MGTWLAGPVLLEVVVPAHNEAERLPAGLGLLCDKLAGLPVRAEVIVVDNASTDGTAEIVRSWRGPVRVRLARCDRRGKGAAVRAGLLATRAPWVGFMDADMATDLAALDDAVALLGDGCPVVVGSRRHDRSVVQAYALPLRRLGAVVFNRIVRDLVGGVTDTQCGFKFFSGPLARAAAADLRTAGFAFDVELLAHCVRRGAGVTDIPVMWRDLPGSTFSVRRHSLPCLKDLALIRARAGSAFIHGTRAPGPSQEAVVWQDENPPASFGTPLSGAAPSGTTSSGTTSSCAVSSGAASSGAASSGAASSDAVSSGAVSSGAVSSGAVSSGAASSGAVSSGTSASGPARYRARSGFGRG